MPKNHKAIHHPSKNARNVIAIGILAVSCFAFLSASIFFATRRSIPAASELSFIEHSVAGRSAGSIIPASCESGYLDSYNDSTTIADFKCYSLYNTGDGISKNFEADILQKTSPEANTICWNITGGGQGGIDYMYEFVPGSASCPTTPTVQLFFSSK